MSGHAMEDIRTFLDEASDVPMMARINEFIDAAFEHDYSPDSGEGRTEPAQFASVLLSAYYPERFVYFRKGRWNTFFRLLTGEKGYWGQS